MKSKDKLDIKVTIELYNKAIQKVSKEGHREGVAKILSSLNTNVPNTSIVTPKFECINESYNPTNTTIVPLILSYILIGIPCVIYLVFWTK